LAESIKAIYYQDYKTAYIAAGAAKAMTLRKKKKKNY
jgi:hypothetical protein